jgi:hypothetical protein
MRDDVKWQVASSMIHPINDVSKLELYNINRVKQKYYERAK